MPKSVQAGEVYLVSKPENASESVVHMSHTAASKARAKERAQPMAAIPEEIPSNKIAVIVKPKQPYRRKTAAVAAVADPVVAPVEVAPVAVVEPVVAPTPVVVEDSDSDSEAEAPPRDLKAIARAQAKAAKQRAAMVARAARDAKDRAKAAKAKAKAMVRWIEESSATSEDDSDDWSDSSDEEAKMNKYARKVHKRAAALRMIEDRLKRISNPYERRGMSIF